MFYETAQTIGPTWHGKSFKPSHYDDLSWTNPTSASRHFRSPGSSPTFRRRIINYDDDDSEPPHMFQKRSPSFEGKFFKDVWNDHPRRDDPFEDRPSLFKRNVKRDWDKDVDDFESSLRRDRDFRNEYQEPEDDGYDVGDESGNGRVHHIPITVERRRGKMKDEQPHHSRCSPPPPPPSSLEQEDFVDESDEWLQHHMNRLKHNFDSGFSTMQNRRNRHRLPRVDLNCRPRAFTSPIPDWGPESVHTLPTRKHHSRVVLDDKRNPKSVFRSYSETHEDIPREHPTASRSHSDSHCPKTTYVTQVPVNVPSEKAEDAGTASYEDAGTASHEDYVGNHEPQPPPRRARCRARKEDGNPEPQQEAEQHQYKKNTSESSTPDQQTESKRRTRCRPRKEDDNLELNQEEEQSHDKKNVSDTPAPDEQSESETRKDDADVSKTEANGVSKARKNSCKNRRGSNALQQISAVLQNVDDLVRHVEAYNGNGRDKQFRFLDEMLTRCMLRLDDVDTDGLDDVRSARKAAVRQVQACIEKLESRAMEEREKNAEKGGGSEDGTKSEESTPDEESKECSGEVTNDAISSEEAEQTRL